jgi:hypothetical protein
VWVKPNHLGSGASGGGKALHRGRINLVRPPAETKVEIRSLAAYDTAPGIVGPEGQSVMVARKSVAANRDLTSELVLLTRGLKAPALRDAEHSKAYGCQVRDRGTGGPPRRPCANALLRGGGVVGRR